MTDRHALRVLPLGLALAALSCATAAAPEPAPRGAGHDLDRTLPPLTLDPLAGGERVHLPARKGKVVLLDIWASWCAPCKEELPLLDDMAARLAKHGVEIVAVSIDEDRPRAEAFLRSRPRWSLTLAHDPAGRVPEALQPPTMPTSYVVDAAGVIRHVNAGFERADAAKLEALLRDLAAGSRP